MAPQGWAEFLAWMQERSAEGTLDPEAAWEQFRALAVTSEHPGLSELVVRFRAAPSKDRLALVGTIASLLAPVEWPRTWEDARWRLVRALDELVREMASHKLDSLSKVVDLGVDEDVYRAGWLDLLNARDLLRTPCRRDELQIVSKLCTTGTAWCVSSLRRALRRLGEQAADEPVVAARRRSAIAFATYAEAARAMNDACGAVLFTGLDLTFEDKVT